MQIEWFARLSVLLLAEGTANLRILEWDCSTLRF